MRLIRIHSLRRIGCKTCMCYASVSYSFPMAYPHKNEFTKSKTSRLFYVFFTKIDKLKCLTIAKLFVSVNKPNPSNGTSKLILNVNIHYTCNV